MPGGEVLIPPVQYFLVREARSLRFAQAYLLKHPSNTAI
jgi:hypothetical protein